jgi:hypothetical protein
MHLEGSCHCGAVTFRVESPNPYPYQRCYCSICRKTQGGGGYAINLGADNDSLRVTGGQHISVYHARLKEPGDARAHRSPGERHFCGRCGSALWLYDARWPELIHPFASAIDTPLPTAPESTHIMLEFKAPWVAVEAGPQDRCFDHYPEESIAEWHARLGLAEGT